MVFAVLVLTGGIALSWASAEEDSLNPKDSVLIELDRVNGVPLPDMQHWKCYLFWRTYIKKFVDSTGAYDSVPEVGRIWRKKFLVELASDSNFQSIVKRVRTRFTDAEFGNLDIGKEYWVRVRLENPGCLQKPLVTKVKPDENVLKLTHSGGISRWERRINIVFWVVASELVLALLLAIVVLAVLLIKNLRSVSGGEQE